MTAADYQGRRADGLKVLAPWEKVLLNAKAKNGKNRKQLLFHNVPVRRISIVRGSLERYVKPAGVVQTSCQALL